MRSISAIKIPPIEIALLQMNYHDTLTKSILTCGILEKEMGHKIEKRHCSFSVQLAKEHVS